MATYNTNTIYTFTKENYPRFEVGTRRHINAKHVDDLQKAYYANPSYIPPIVVNLVTMRVVDGGHRLSAILKAWENGNNIPIRVIFVEIPEDAERKTIIDMNCGAKSWTLVDYINDLIENNHNENAIRLRDFATTSRFLYRTKKNGEKVPNYRYACAVLKGRNQSDEITNGLLSVTREEVLLGTKYYTELEAILDSLRISRLNTNFESLASVWYRLRTNNTQFSDALEKVSMRVYLKTIGNEDNRSIGLNGGKSYWEKIFENALKDAMSISSLLAA